MTKIFTKADIEFEHFLEILKPAEAKDVQLEETQVKNYMLILKIWNLKESMS